MTWLHGHHLLEFVVWNAIDVVELSEPPLLRIQPILVLYAQSREKRRARSRKTRFLLQVPLRLAEETAFICLIPALLLVRPKQMIPCIVGFHSISLSPPPLLAPSIPKKTG